MLCGGVIIFTRWAFAFTHRAFAKLGHNQPTYNPSCHPVAHSGDENEIQYRVALQT